MKRLKLATGALTLSALAACIALLPMTATAKTPRPTGLFSNAPGEYHRVLPAKSKRGKSKAIHINHNKLDKDRFFIDLPGDVSFEVVRKLRKNMGKGRFAWVGHAGDNPNSRAILGVSGDAVAGTFEYRGKMYKLEPRANGGHVVSEVDGRDPAPERDPIPVFDFTVNPNPGSSPETLAADSNGAVIDILVAYTPAVQSLYGAQGVEALIIQAMAETNQAYANSGMSTRLNLVRSTLTNYVSSGNMAADISRLRNTSDGYMDELHTLRNTYGADVVSLIENEPQYCGIAYQMANLSSSFASNAFSVVHHSCATGYYSFGHEIGHNQGMAHDPGNSGSSIYPYAYGYQEPFGAFRTVMAYNCPGGCLRVNHFSNPYILFNGVPTGIVDYTDNARAIDNTAATVAGFRQSMNPLPPATPANLEATGNGTHQIQLNWTDTSADESGFVLERSTNSGAFEQIVSLPANANNYLDEGLQAGAQYSYRASAWNSYGSSAYSNQAVAATDPVNYVEQVAFWGLGAANILTGDWRDTHFEDDIVLSLEEIPVGNGAKAAQRGLEYYWAFTVQPGETITVAANANTTSLREGFIFAYSTIPITVSADKESWVDMFAVSPWFPGELQFTLPADVSGPVYISVRDIDRTPENPATSLQIDSLSIRTQIGSE